MRLHLDLDRYLLRIFFLISLIVSGLVMMQLGPAYPVFSIFKYGVLTLGIVFSAYLTAFMGILAYFSTKTRIMDTALSDANVLAKFTDSLAEPMVWANWATLLMLIYYALTAVALPWVGAYAFVLSVAVTATTAFSIFRNFHLVRMYLVTTMQAVVMQEEVRTVLMRQIEERIEQAAQEGTFEGKPEVPSPAEPPPADTVQ